MTIQIKQNLSRQVIFESQSGSIKEAVMEAIQKEIDLSDANLFGANLSKANLSKANLSDANLSKANLSKANLSDANLSGADLSDANLSGANLFGANLSKANLSKANLSDANLSGAHFYDEKLKITPLQLCNFRWDILITAKYMKIGCELHSHSDWEQFNRLQISRMEEGAWDWWKEHKTVLLELCRIHKLASDKIDGEGFRHPPSASPKATE